MNHATSAVEFRAVSKLYGPVAAVDAISFAIFPGTLVTLLGPSGCGKTTTLRMIAGLEPPSSGRIFIDGNDVTRMPAAERDVSMVFQSCALFPHMTVLENVSYGLRAAGTKKARAAEQAMEKLSLVGLTGFEHRLPSELSGGQQQRVAVARAIVLEPKVLLFDEPLSNLDARLRRRVREEIRGLQQSLALTVVYVTHDQEEALAVSDRIIVMNTARIAQDGTPRALFEAPASRFIASFIGDANLLPVHIERRDGDHATIRLAGTTLELPHRGLFPGPAQLAVRPRALRLLRRPPGPGELACRVQKSAYLGTHMEYEVAVPGLEEDLFVIDPDVAQPLAQDAPAAIGFVASAITLVPET